MGCCREGPTAGLAWEVPELWDFMPVIGFPQLKSESDFSLHLKVVLWQGDIQHTQGSVMHIIRCWETPAIRKTIAPSSRCFSSFSFSGEFLYFLWGDGSFTVIYFSAFVKFSFHLASLLDSLFQLAKSRKYEMQKNVLFLLLLWWMFYSLI